MVQYIIYTAVNLKQGRPHGVVGRVLFKYDRDVSFDVRDREGRVKGSLHEEDEEGMKKKRGEAAERRKPTAGRVGLGSLYG
ncbi:hypothetical protein HanRHA438_Chr04g0195301 [Helianthus annuus]|nr:hypothetical protein HanRHA438_Chr04g0195301 [Helianthus annuus]